MSRSLPRAFFARPAVEVAPALLGNVLVRAVRGGRRIAARIVETEAYEEGDPASHSFRGKTARNAVMFGPSGHLYMYFTYGLHFCANVVTGEMGEGSAVLLRAAEPLEGLDLMARRRGVPEPGLLCSGPARLAQAFGLDLRHDGLDLAGGGTVWVERGTPIPAERIAGGPRVGIRYGTERPWRFLATGNPYLSRGGAGSVRGRERAARPTP